MTGTNQASINFQLQASHPRGMECSDLSPGTRPPQNILPSQDCHDQISLIYWIQAWLLGRALNIFMASKPRMSDLKRANCRVATKDISFWETVPKKDSSSSEHFPTTPSPLFSNMIVSILHWVKCNQFSVHSNSESTQDSVVHRHSTVHTHPKCPNAFNSQIPEVTSKPRQNEMVLLYSNDLFFRKSTDRYQVFLVSYHILPYLAAYHPWITSFDYSSQISLKSAAIMLQNIISASAATWRPCPVEPRGYTG